MKTNLAVFISGEGSNLQIFLNNKDYFNSLFVVSSRAGARGLQRAEESGVEQMVLGKPIDWQQLQAELERQNINMIFLAGFMRILPPEFIAHWEGRLFNLHPSMLPKYKGLKAVEQAIDAKDDVGVSIHHVVAEVDAGKVVSQRVAVPWPEAGELTHEALLERVHACEHEMVQEWIDRLK